MPDWQLQRMFPTVPASLIRVHNWREDVVTIGEVSAAFVSEATEGIYAQPWPAQLNKLVWQGGHDLILSIGQVVPHEVIGMANYNKNLFVGTGGSARYQRKPLHRCRVWHGEDDGACRYALAAHFESRAK